MEEKTQQLWNVNSSARRKGKKVHCIVYEQKRENVLCIISNKNQ